MDPETLLSGIREMISAGARLATATDPEERRIAGSLYTINEGVVLDQLTKLHALHLEVAKNLASHEESIQGLCAGLRSHGHNSFQRY